MSELLATTLFRENTHSKEARLLIIADIGRQAPEALSFEEIRMLCETHLAQNSAPALVDEDVANDS